MDHMRLVYKKTTNEGNFGFELVKEVKNVEELSAIMKDMIYYQGISPQDICVTNVGGLTYHFAEKYEAGL